MESGKKRDNIRLSTTIIFMADITNFFCNLIRFRLIIWDLSFFFLFSLKELRSSSDRDEIALEICTSSGEIIRIKVWIGDIWKKILVPYIPSDLNESVEGVLIGQ